MLLFVLSMNFRLMSRIYQVSSLNVRINRVTYAATLKLVRTTTTLPLVRKLILPISVGLTYGNGQVYSPFPAQTILTNLTKELPIPLHTPKSAHTQDTCTICREKCALAISPAVSRSRSA